MADLPSYLDDLDQLLCEQSDDWMMLAQLDGFLAGLVASPDPVEPAVWLRSLWGGEGRREALLPEEVQAYDRISALAMRRHYEIAMSLSRPEGFEPIFDIDPANDDVLWESWIDGFVEAMELAPNGWHRAAASGDSSCIAALQGIAKLRAIVTGESRLSVAKRNRWTWDAPDFIPEWVEALHAWRLGHDPDETAPAPAIKAGRNDPCPCGSGKKYKKCCGAR